MTKKHHKREPKKVLKTSGRVWETAVGNPPSNADYHREAGRAGHGYGDFQDVQPGQVLVRPGHPEAGELEVVAFNVGFGPGDVYVRPVGAPRGERTSHSIRYLRSHWYPKDRYEERVKNGTA